MRTKNKLLFLVFISFLITFMIYGGHGWGFQRGGSINFFLTKILFLITIYNIVIGSIRCYKLKNFPEEKYFIIAIIFGSISFVYWWVITGWEMMTSIHFQGEEKYVGIIILFIINIVCIRQERYMLSKWFD